MNISVAATCPGPQAQPTTGKGPGSESNSPTGWDASQQQRPVYTTAGTVWNPESAKPIRAPVRRGRATAGAFGTPLGDQWTFPNQHDGLFHPGQAPPVVPHYAPLQQNNDRAVSPSPPLSIHGGIPASTEMASIEADAGRSPTRPSMTPRSSQSDMASLKLEGDEDDDAADRERLRRFTMKSLVSLASYENPNQQTARDLLRVKPNPDPPSGGPPATLNNPAEAAAPNAARRVQPLAAAAPHFVPAQQGQTYARPPVDSSAMPPKMPIGNQGAQQRRLGLFPSTTLATGPGAPEPLKAGPPGQRPQGPSRIGSALAASVQGPANNAVQPANGIYPTQPYRQQPVLDVPKETGGFSIAGPSRPIPAKHYGYDGARSSKEHVDTASEFAAAVRNFNFAAHPGFRDATRASLGGGSASEASSRVATPPGFIKPDNGRSRGNSSESARSGSGGVNIHQFSGYNTMPDQRAHDALPLPGQGPGASDQALPALQPTMIDPSCQNTASTMDTRGAQFVGAHPGQVPNNNCQSFGKHWGDENLGSNICRVDSANTPYGGAGIMPGLDGSHKQFSAVMQAPVGFQTMPAPGDAGYWSHNVEKLEPFGWDPAEYHMPYSGQYPYGAMKINDKMLRENEAKINAWFYSNTSRLGRTMDEVLDDRRHPKARPSPFGSIGDGRPAPKPGPKHTYSQISIEEANKMPISEHAEPLLNLAFQAILDFKDDEADRECCKMNERKVKDGGAEEGYEKLGSAPLFPGSFSDSD